MNIDVIRLAREAGIEWQQHTGVIGRITVTTCGSQSLERLERFAALVMEEDAKVCETVGNHNITAACAAAIRARKPA